MITNVVIKLKIEGIHNWPDASKFFPEVSFLEQLHRHIFHIKCEKTVSHNDRDVEIILLKRKVIEYLQKKYGIFEKVYKWDGDVTIFRYCSFGSMSCEMIAEELVKEFELYSCEVLEDNENGAVVIK